MDANSSEEIVRLQAFVSGFVQGVGYRYFAMKAAHQSGLTGWVRNLPDGSVQVVAEGKRSQLETFLNTLKRGPASSRVDFVRTAWHPARSEFDRFEVRY